MSRTDHGQREVKTARRCLTLGSSSDKGIPVSVRPGWSMPEDTPSSGQLTRLVALEVDPDFDGTFTSPASTRFAEKWENQDDLQTLERARAQSRWRRNEHSHASSDAIAAPTMRSCHRRASRCPDVQRPVGCPISACDGSPLSARRDHVRDAASRARRSHPSPVL